MSPTSMATRLRDIHAETWNVPHAASVLWTNKLWHNWQPVWEMPAHYDGKRSEQRLTAVCRASESELSRTLHLAGLLARVNSNFVEKRSTGAVFLGVCSDLRSRMSRGPQIQAEHPHSITLSAGFLPASLTENSNAVPLIHIDFSWHASWGWTFHFSSACAWTPCQQSPAASGWCSRRMTRPTYPRSASRRCSTATWGHTDTRARGTGLEDCCWQAENCRDAFPQYRELYPKGLGSAALVIDTAQYFVVTRGTPLICSSQRKSGLK